MGRDVLSWYWLTLRLTATQQLFLYKMADKTVVVREGSKQDRLKGALEQQVRGLQYEYSRATKGERGRVKGTFWGAPHSVWGAWQGCVAGGNLPPAAQLAHPVGIVYNNNSSSKKGEL